MLIRSQYHPIISSRLNQGHTWSLKYLITTANCSGALIVGNWFAQYCFRVLVEPWVLQRWQHAWWSTKCLKAKSNSSARVAASKSPICTRNLMVMISLHSYQKNFIPPVQPTGLTVYQQPSLYPYGLLAARYPWPIQPNPAVTRRSQPTGHPGDDCPCQTLNWSLEGWAVPKSWSIHSSVYDGCVMTIPQSSIFSFSQWRSHEIIFPAGAWWRMVWQRYGLGHGVSETFLMRFLLSQQGYALRLHITVQFSDL